MKIFKLLSIRRFQNSREKDEKYTKIIPQNLMTSVELRQFLKFVR